MSAERVALITGGAGFIGTNVAHRLLEAGRTVRVFDNLSRAGVERNLRWLTERHGDRVQFARGDVRDAAAVGAAVADAAEVFHFAAQVAVTTSLATPVDDFDVNARGTLNVLEAIRATGRRVPLLFTSTNKVYGRLRGLALRADGQRYEPADAAHAAGVSEDAPLDFESPYGCSKGAADQYVLDYARSFGVPAVVFRMSCIYGPHQFGTEDQGWVAHFLIRALEERPITIYGDGRQVRDVLFVEDLVDAMLLARRDIVAVTGRAFNIGGGPGAATSLLELVELIGRLPGGAPVRLEHGPWRVGDQRYYVTDARAFRQATGWSPRVDIAAGVRRLHAWLRESRGAVAP